MQPKPLAVFALALVFPIAACNSAPQHDTAQISNSETTGSFAQPDSTLTVRRPRVHPHATISAPGVFDYYLLTLSWSPEYCNSHASAPECANHSTFVLHGLWPENNDGSYPQNCSNAPGPANPAQYADIYPDAGLLQHEWSTHGTCSGLAPDAFFIAARTAFHSVKAPPVLSTLTKQISLTPGQITGSYTQSNPALSNADLAVSCGNNYLTAVEVCLDKSLHPTACHAIKSCRANTIRVPPPQ